LRKRVAVNEVQEPGEQSKLTEIEENHGSVG
jgi:hypothetical protein